MRQSLDEFITKMQEVNTCAKQIENNNKIAGEHLQQIEEVATMTHNNVMAILYPEVGAMAQDNAYKKHRE